MKYVFYTTQNMSSLLVVFDLTETLLIRYNANKAESFFEIKVDWYIIFQACQKSIDIFKDWGFMGVFFHYKPVTKILKKERSFTLDKGSNLDLKNIFTSLANVIYTVKPALMATYE